MLSDAFLAVGLSQDNWGQIGDLCWITCGIGLAAVATGLVLAGWIEAEGLSVAAVSSSLVVIGLPMGIVGTVRRRRAERERAVGDEYQR